MKSNELVIISTMSLLYFIGASINKIINFNNVVSNFMSTITPVLSIVLSKPLPIWLFRLIIICVILLQFGGSSIVLMAAYNGENIILNKMARISLYALIIFSIMATLLYHMKMDKQNIIMTLANISVISGLWLLSRHFN